MCIVNPAWKEYVTGFSGSDYINTPAYVYALESVLSPASYPAFKNVKRGYIHEGTKGYHNDYIAPDTYSYIVTAWSGDIIAETYVTSDSNEVSIIIE